MRQFKALLRELYEYKAENKKLSKNSISCAHVYEPNQIW